MEEYIKGIDKRIFIAIVIFLFTSLGSFIFIKGLVRVVENEKSKVYIYTVDGKVYDDITYPSYCKIRNMTCTVDGTTFKVDSIKKKNVNDNE